MPGEGILVWMLRLFETNPETATVGIMGVCFATFVVITLRSQNEKIKRLEGKMSVNNDRVWPEIRKLDERYHRLDSLALVQAKLMQLAKTGKVKLVNEGANGDGDYTIDRSI